MKGGEGSGKYLKAMKNMTSNDATSKIPTAQAKLLRLAQGFRKQLTIA